MAADGRMVLALVPILALVVAAPAGCFFTPDSFRGPLGSGGAGGESSGSGGGTGQGGTGQGGTCIKDTDCTDGNDCTDNICANVHCIYPTNDTLVPPDSNPCTKDVCKGGVASHTIVVAGTPCGTDLQCDFAGVCQCTVDAQCGASTPCVKKTCDGAKGCVETILTDVVLPDPIPNDCKGVKCDKTGNEVVFDDDSDLPVDDGVVCTEGFCGQGNGDYMLSPAGTPCMGSNVCDADGFCVFCTPSFGCDKAAGEVCVGGTQCSSCTDGLKNGFEPDVDCGGSCPGKCANGMSCVGAGDCQSAKCVDGVCCNAACAGECLACNLPGKGGVCTNLPDGAGDPGVCNDGDLCDGGGACQTPSGLGTKAIGEACSGNAYCFNNNCAFGFCKSQIAQYCSKNWDCATYNCVGNLCVLCNVNADCPDMNQCSSNICKLSVGELCKSNSDCQSSFCGGNPKKCQP